MSRDLRLKIFGASVIGIGIGWMLGVALMAAMPRPVRPAPAPMAPSCSCPAPPPAPGPRPNPWPKSMVVACPFCRNQMVVYPGQATGAIPTGGGK